MIVSVYQFTIAERRILYRVYDFKLTDRGFVSITRNRVHFASQARPESEFTITDNDTKGEFVAPIVCLRGAAG